MHAPDALFGEVPPPGFHRLAQRLVVPNGVGEPVEQHAVYLHPARADVRLGYVGEIVRSEILVSANRRGGVAAVSAAAVRLSPREWRQRQLLVVVVLFLEVLAVGEEVEQLERGLSGAAYFVVVRIRAQLLAEVVRAGSAPLYLREVGRGEYRAEHAEIQNVGAVVTCGHHADGDAYARLARGVFVHEIARAKQVVVGEVDSHLLGVGDVGRHLNGEVRPVLAGEHGVGYPVQYLREPRGVALADCEDYGFANLAANRIAQRVLHEGSAEHFICGFREELALEIALAEGVFMRFAFSVVERDGETAFGEHPRGHVGARVHERGAD